MLPGAADASTSVPQEEENMSHDSNLIWPLPHSEIPSDWKDMLKQRDNDDAQNRFFLNHVRGNIRFRQAFIRIGCAIGTILEVWFMSTFLDPPKPKQGTTNIMPLFFIFFKMSPRDIYLGIITGILSVSFLFLIEWYMNWIHIVGYFKTIVPEEKWICNISWDVLFHIGVAINEELSVRGWFLHNLSLILQTQYYDTSIGNTTLLLLSPEKMAMASAIIIQSILFSILHLTSPGITIQALVNLFIGGLAAGINVFWFDDYGKLDFVLGWHFGWNLTMGHLLGLSTSGIPMSCAMIEVVPHPKKMVWHGGEFGPEGGRLAILGYGFGILLLVLFYGF